MMQELLNVPGTQLHGETSGGGILWAIYDAYAPVMDLECLDVYVGWVLDKPHLVKIQETFNSIP